MFENRHVVITGGAGALGAAVVAALVADGAFCHVPFVAPGQDQRFALRNDSRVTLTHVGDLADEAAVSSYYQRLPPLWASIHLAGGFAMAAVAQTSRAALMRQIEMNFVTTFLCCGAAVRNMRAAGAEGSGEGRIVNVAARPALEWRGGAGMAAYAASKAAVAALTVALAEEVAGAGILVNAVAPSIIDTPANRTAMPRAAHAAWPKVEAVAATIVFLASPANKVTRGAIVPVYGKS